MEQYTVDYFIQKFEAIPEHKWYIGGHVDPNDETRCCAYGHCGERRHKSITLESQALFELFFQFGLHDVSEINDRRECGYNQTTPKQRILSALYDIKNKQENETI
jgi:hypothetical protein